MFEEAPLGEATAFHFYAVPLREIAVEESADGKIDTTFRCSSLNWHGIRTRFPEPKFRRHWPNAAGKTATVV